MDERLAIIKTVKVYAGNRHYTVDKKPGTNCQPDYYVITEHKGAKRYKVVIAGADVPKIINALQEASR